MNAIFIQPYDAPCGRLLLGSFANHLCLCDWEQGWHRSTTEARLKRLLKADFIEKGSDIIKTARQQLDAYFHRERITFDLPLLFAGTEFQKTVWKALGFIPYGTTVSYADLARQIGMPNAVRAVANANGANPVSIFVPCHRVIGGDGSLTGYGGGLDTKRFLLQLEAGLSLGR